MFEFDGSPEMVAELMRSGRFEVRWSGSIVKWVSLRDQLTGSRAVGRSYDSWHTALGLAVQEMRRLIAETGG